MSTSGPPADAKKAQTAAMAELEAALKKKKAIESTLVCLTIISFPLFKTTDCTIYLCR